MRDAKLILIVTIGLLLGFQCPAQVFNGSYHGVDALTQVSDVGIRYDFKNDSVFIKTAFQHLGIKEIEEGTYSYSGDTLSLDYANVTGENNSVTITEKNEYINNNPKDNPSVLTTQIQVSYDDEKPQLVAILTIRDENDDVMMAFMSDKSGLFPSFTICDTGMTQIKLTSLGMIDQTIPTKDLFGYQTKIEVLFSDTSINAGQSQSGKYILSLMDDGKIMLDPIEGNTEKMILEKIED